MRLSIQLKLVVTLAVSLVLYGCAGETAYRPFTVLYDLKISFADDTWDGNTIPAGQQCPTFGGKGSTPGLTVENIPPQANALILEFSNKSHLPLDKGGQGQIGYRFIPGTHKIVLPPVSGNTFDLPEPFFVIAAHRKPFQSKPGAYLPPCSGGKGNYYYLVVKAILLPVSLEIPAELLGQGKIALGRY